MKKVNSHTDSLSSNISVSDIAGGIPYDKSTDEKYMKKALQQAKKAAKIGEVPIGCVIVYEDKIIGRGYNRRKKDKNTLSHAELIAIRKASRVMGDWRLEGCTMYVTLEPCQMCAGAIVQARMDRVVIAAMSPKSGCAGSIINLLQMDEFNHRVEITTGVLEKDCSSFLSSFFVDLRKRLKTENESVETGVVLNNEAEECDMKGNNT